MAGFRRWRQGLPRITKGKQYILCRKEYKQISFPSHTTARERREQQLFPSHVLTRGLESEEGQQAHGMCVQRGAGASQSVRSLARRAG